ncbi:MAG: (2Fe-2S)-binding protein [Actinomycetota bacterium]|nr:(2Fe-2S)-binding protein [Actinomycetota bacterium]MDP9020425.1 (2Fe-2S)-binding protein [Actinomycetota bacterium]
MVVCHCRAVSDCRVRQAIEAGAGDVEAIARQCGAGMACGGCRPALAMLLSELGLDSSSVDRNALPAA